MPPDIRYAKMKTRRQFLAEILAATSMVPKVIESATQNLPGDIECRDYEHGVLVSRRFLTIAECKRFRAAERKSKI